MRPYAVFIHQAALDAAPRAGHQRRMVMEFVRSLASNPFARGDFSQQDASGRIVEVKLIGRYAITWWADHAACEVKVTHIKPANA